MPYFSPSRPDHRHFRILIKFAQIFVCMSYFNPKHLLLVFSCCVSSLVLFAGTPVIRITPAPSWLIAHERPVPQSLNKKDVPGGAYLVEYEQQYHAELKARYVHIITEIMNDAGVQNSSDINVDFNPAYEKIEFHDIRVIRQGKVLPRNVAFQAIQQETDLQRFIYNGEYSAYAALDDIRKGDRIEYSYTVTGANPVFKGKFFEDLYIHSGTPIGNSYCNVIYSPGRTLNFRSFGKMPAAKERLAGNLLCREWAMTDLPAIQGEDYEASFYSRYPHIQVSEYQSWKEVIEWGLTINSLSAFKKPAIAAKAAELWKTAGKDSGTFIARCTRFVQDEVRYLGVEIGEYSHRSNEPEKILNQRYGDCKDKSMLLVSLLRAGGVDASIAYVSSFRGKELPGLLPSPMAFNHAIVYLKYEGNEQWIDPTISNQRGPIERNYIPPYGHGLIIDPSREDLVKIPETSGGWAMIEETYDVKWQDEPTILRVETEYTWNRADEIREMLQNTGVGGLQGNFLNYYGTIFPDIKVAEAIRIIDDSINNTIRVYEKYSIKDFWQQDDKNKGQISAYVTPALISQQFINLSSSERTAPIWIHYPFHTNYKITLNMPEAWVLETSVVNVACDAYEFSYNSRLLGGNQIVLNYNLKTLSDYLPADQAAQYISNFRKVNNTLGYSVSYEGPAPTAGAATAESPAGPLMVIFFLNLFLVFIFLFVKCLKLSKPATEDQVNYNYRIGSWLILVAIGIALSPFTIISNVFRSPYFNSGLYEVYTGSGGNPLAWKALLMLEFSGNLLLLVMSVLVMILFFNRRNTAPKFVTWFYGINAGFVTINYLVGVAFFNSNNIGINIVEGVDRVIAAVLSAAIWIPYFLRSERVRETFVFPWSMGEVIRNRPSAAAATNDALPEEAPAIDEPAGMPELLPVSGAAEQPLM
jgi:transglutaminase-like putative cysteine protease